MYILYTRQHDEWVFWNDQIGWAHLSVADKYNKKWPAVEGKFLYIGKDGELAGLATVILDLEKVLDEHKDTNLASAAGLRAMASWLAEGLALAPDQHYPQYAPNVIYEDGYALYIP